jgi:hypothetical protein
VFLIERTTEQPKKQPSPPQQQKTYTDIDSTDDTNAAAAAPAAALLRFFGGGGGGGGISLTSVVDDALVAWLVCAEFATGAPTLVGGARGGGGSRCVVDAVRRVPVVCDMFTALLSLRFALRPRQ